MAKKKTKKSPVSDSKVNRSIWQPSYWMIVAFIAIFFAGWGYA